MQPCFLWQKGTLLMVAFLSAGYALLAALRHGQAFAPNASDPATMGSLRAGGYLFASTPPMHGGPAAAVQPQAHAAVPEDPRDAALRGELARVERTSSLGEQPPWPQAQQLQGASTKPAGQTSRDDISAAPLATQTEESQADADGSQTEAGRPSTMSRPGPKFLVVVILDGADGSILDAAESIWQVMTRDPNFEGPPHISG